MAITRDEYDKLRASGVSHEDIAAGRYQKQPGFFESVVKAVPNLAVKAGTRFGQAIAGAGVQAFGSQEQKDRLADALSKQTRVPGALGGFNVNPVQSGRQVVGEAIGDAVTIASAAYAPAVKSGVGFVRGAVQGAKSAAPAAAGFGAADELGRSITKGRGVGETVGRTVAAGVSGGLTGGLLGGAIGGVGGRIAYNAARKQELLKIFQNNPEDARVAQYAKAGADSILGPSKLVKDKAAKAAIDSGVDNASVAVFKGASKSDKTAFGKMLDVYERGKVDAKFRALNRPSDVIAEPIINQAKLFGSTLKTEGAKLDSVAKSLKGKTVGDWADPIVESIQTTFNRNGITANGAALDFAGSNFEGLGAPNKLIGNVWARIYGAQDALDLHRVKRLIDNSVEYGKAADGLTGEATSMLKMWRRAIDGVLDARFPEYNAVNTKLSTAFDGLDALGDLAGKSFRATDDFAAARIGQIARGILSNSRNRGDVLTRMNDMQNAAKALGQNVDSDVVSRVLFFDEMERLFGTMAPTSLQGQTGRAIQDAARGVGVMRQVATGDVVGAGLALAGKAADRLEKTAQDKQLQVLRSLISQ